jgi:hypothetical protein
MKRIFLILFISLITNLVFADEHEQGVLGNDVEDLLKNSESASDSPYLKANSKNLVDEIESNETSSAIYGTAPKELDGQKVGNEFKDNGYTLPGTFEKTNSYTEIDKDHYTDQIRKQSTSAFNLIYLKDGYNYQSPGDVINRTLANGYKHMQSGFLLIRSDNYFFRSSYLNLHWAMGTGLSYNYGRGIFADGERSEAGFRLWEIPVDLGLGFEIPISRFFKLSATAGPSALVLVQNRDDLNQNEAGKNKVQTGFGQFASAQFKLNLLSFAAESSYELFASNQITSCYLTLEGRYHSYEKYLEEIKISGTSFGAGLTFEFL